MPRLIEEGGRQVFSGLESLIKFVRGFNLVEQCLRHWFAGLVMFCVIGEDFRPRGPHLVYLRRIFDEITRHARSTKPRIFYVRKHAVERMTKFVERGPHLIL